MRVLVIEKAAVKQNIRVVKRRAGGAAVYGVLSGDAGGAGIAEMAELLRAEGIGRFAVSEAEEAEALLRDLVEFGRGFNRPLDVGEAGALSASLLWARGRKDEAVDALAVLGFTPGEASAAVGKLDSALPVETLVRQALKSLGRKS